MERARLCSRAGCAEPAAARLLFHYGTRQLWLEDLGDREPNAIDLCAMHADRIKPPVGWTGEDRRGPSGSAALVAS